MRRGLPVFSQLHIYFTAQHILELSKGTSKGRKGVNLNYLYETIVSSVKIGRSGYAVVKDKDLAVIMHHARSQIGMDAVYDRADYVL